MENCGIANAELLVQPHRLKRSRFIHSSYRSKKLDDIILSKRETRFLFSPEEQFSAITINMNSVHILLAELEVMRIKNNNLETQNNNIQNDYLSLKATCASAMLNSTQPALGERSESTYLTVIGALISLYNKHSPSGRAYTLLPLRMQ